MAKPDVASSKFISFIENLEHLTDINAHGEAREQIAEYFDMKNFLTIFEAISMIQDLERSLPQELSKYREQKTKEMLSWISKSEGQEVADLIYNAL